MSETDPQPSETLTIVNLEIEDENSSQDNVTLNNNEKDKNIPDKQESDSITSPGSPSLIADDSTCNTNNGPDEKITQPLQHVSTEEEKEKSKGSSETTPKKIDKTGQNKSLLEQESEFQINDKNLTINQDNGAQTLEVSDIQGDIMSVNESPCNTGKKVDPTEPAISVKNFEETKKEVKVIESSQQVLKTPFNNKSLETTNSSKTNNEQKKVNVASATNASALENESITKKRQLNVYHLHTLKLFGLEYQMGLKDARKYFMQQLKDAELPPMVFGNKDKEKAEKCKTIYTSNWPTWLTPDVIKLVARWFTDINFDVVNCFIEVLTYKDVTKGIGAALIHFDKAEDCMNYFQQLKNITWFNKNVTVDLDLDNKIKNTLIGQYVYCAFVTGKPTTEDRWLDPKVTLPNRCRISLTSSEAPLDYRADPVPLDRPRLSFTDEQQRLDMLVILRVLGLPFGAVDKIKAIIKERTANQDILAPKINFAHNIVISNVASWFQDIHFIYLLEIFLTETDLSKMPFFVEILQYSNGVNKGAALVRFSNPGTCLTVYKQLKRIELLNTNKKKSICVNLDTGGKVAKQINSSPALANWKDMRTSRVFCSRYVLTWEEMPATHTPDKPPRLQLLKKKLSEKTAKNQELNANAAKKPKLSGPDNTAAAGVAKKPELSEPIHSADASAAKKSKLSEPDNTVPASAAKKPKLSGPDGTAAASAAKKLEPSEPINSADASAANKSKLSEPDNTVPASAAKKPKLSGPDGTAAASAVKKLEPSEPINSADASAANKSKLSEPDNTVPASTAKKPKLPGPDGTAATSAAKKLEPSEPINYVDASVANKSKLSEPDNTVPASAAKKPKLSRPDGTAATSAAKKLEPSEPINSADASAANKSKLSEPDNTVPASAAKKPKLSGPDGTAAASAAKKLEPSEPINSTDASAANKSKLSEPDDTAPFTTPSVDGQNNRNTDSKTNQTPSESNIEIKNETRTSQVIDMETNEETEEDAKETTSTKESEEIAKQTAGTIETKEIAKRTARSNETEKIAKQTASTNETQEKNKHTASTKESEEIAKQTASTKETQQEPKQTAKTQESKEIPKLSTKNSKEITEQSASTKESVEISKQSVITKGSEDLVKQIANTKESEKIAKESASTKKSKEIAKQSAISKESEEIANQSASTKESEEIAKQLASSKESEEIVKQISSTKESEDIDKQIAGTKESEDIDAQTARTNESDGIAKQTASTKESEEMDTDTDFAIKDEDLVDVSEDDDETNFTSKTTSKTTDATSLQKNQRKDMRVIHLKNLVPVANVSAVKCLFRDYTHFNVDFKIFFIRKLRDEDNSILNECLLKFDNPSDALKIATSVDGLNWRGQNIWAELKPSNYAPKIVYVKRKPDEVAKAEDLPPLKIARFEDEWEVVDPKRGFLPGALKTEETFGVNPAILSRLGVKKLISPLIIVNNLHEEVSDAKLHEIFSIAGHITHLRTIVKFSYKRARIEYEHPVEALQAVSMFNGQKLYGLPMRVSVSTETNAKLLPAGLEGIGKGFGPKGLPLTSIQTHVFTRKLFEIFQRMGYVDKIRDDFHPFQGYFEVKPPHLLPHPSPFHNQQQPRNNWTGGKPSVATAIEALGTVLLALDLVPPDTDIKNLQSIIYGLQQHPKVKQHMNSKNRNNAPQNQTSSQGPNPTDPNNQAEAFYQNLCAYMQNMGYGGNFQQMSYMGDNSGQNPFQMFASNYMNMNAVQQNQNVPSQSVGMNVNVQPAAVGVANYGVAVPGMTANVQNAGYVYANVNPSVANTSVPNQSVGTPTIQRAPVLTGVSNTNTNIHQSPNQNQGKKNVVEAPSPPRWSDSNNSQRNPAQGTQSSASKRPSKSGTRSHYDEDDSRHSSSKSKDRDGFNSDMLQFKNLPPSVTQKALTRKMEEVGDIVFAEMTSKGRALVRFKKVEDAARCHRLFHHSKVDGHIVDVTPV